MADDTLTPGIAPHDMDLYVAEVVKTWEEYWKPKVHHRYGQSFHAFLGERILTDFDLRQHDRPNPHAQHLFQLCDAPGPKRCVLVKNHGGGTHVSNSGTMWPVDHG